MNQVRLYGSLCLVVALGLGAGAQAAPAPVDINSIKASPALEKMLPAAYQGKGKTLVAGVNPDVAPVKFVDEDGNLTGLIPQLVQAGARKLGLKIDFQQASFDALIPGMKANRFNFILSLADFPSRQKMLTLVDYLNIGDNIVVKPTDDLVVKSFDDLCGISVSIPRGTATIPRADEISKKCVAEGKKPIDVSTYPDTNTTMLAISNGSSRATWQDSPVASYNASKFPDRYKIIYQSYIAPYAVGFGADQEGRQLAKAFQAAFLELNKEGVYPALLNYWGLGMTNAIPAFTIDGAK